MVHDAERYAEEDQQMRNRIMAKNTLESYLFTVKDTLEKDLAESSGSSQERKELLDLIDDTWDWMNDNPEGSQQDFEERKKSIEDLANPLLRYAYTAAGPGTSNDDFGDDEL
jgi:molecular chaperone DnaK (HSP70)